MGFVLVSSRDTLADPGNLPGYTTFLSMFINGLWMRISEPWGLLGARAGVVVVYWFIFSSTYIVLKDFMRAQYALIALLVTFIFTQRTFWISYNDITALFACLTITSLYFAFKQQKSPLYILSGALCALAFFARFPNILMIGFGFLPLITQIAARDDFFDKDIWKNTAFFFVGYGGICLFVVAVMMLTGYWTHYARSFFDMAELASGNSIHSSASLLTRFFEDHKRVLSLGVVLFFSGTGIRWFLRFRRISLYFVIPTLTIFSFYFGWNYYIFSFLISPVLFWLALAGFFWIAWMFFIKEHQKIVGCNHQKIVFVFCLLISFAALLGSIYYLYRNPRASIYDPVFGLIYIVNAVALVRSWRQGDRTTFFVLSAGISMMLTVPLGSSNGIRNALHGLWFSLPLTLNVIQKIQLEYLGSSKPCMKPDALFLKLGVILLLAVSVAVSYRYTYRDSNDRFEMRFTVDHPKLRGIYTTKERAGVVQEVLDELGKYVKPGDYLLGYHTVSTLYFLTETRPYLYNSWPFLYEPDLLRHYLEKAQKERPEDPVVVRSKYSLQNFEWPKRNFMNRSAKYTENLKIMADYLQDKKYQKVWENEVFEILCVK